MSARLRVEELRAELQRRGLDASGNKPALVRRLDGAIRKEEKDAAAAAATAAADGDGAVMNSEGNGGSKRKRRRTGNGEEEGNGDASSEAAKLEGMGTVSCRGWPRHGSLRQTGERRSFLRGRSRLQLMPWPLRMVVFRTRWKLQVVMRGLRRR